MSEHQKSLEGRVNAVMDRSARLAFITSHKTLLRDQLNALEAEQAKIGQLFKVLNDQYLQLCQSQIRELRSEFDDVRDERRFGQES